MKKPLALIICLGGLWWFPLPDHFLNPAKSDLSVPAVWSSADSLLFTEKQQVARVEGTLADRTMAVARSFAGFPYVKGCLDCYKEEQLIINLRQLDCWTFVEYSLAIAQTHERDYAGFASFVQDLRYWGGHINGYGSRIHYFTGWLLQAEKLGFLKDMTAEMGGISYKKNIGYISARPQKYPKIQDKVHLQAIRQAEKRINAHHWSYIPKNKIAQMEHLIQEGDIICLTSFKADLDIAHQGFAVKQNGRIYLMHASSLAGKVVLSRQPLPLYVAGQKGQTGIMVARLM